MRRARCRHCKEPIERPGGTWRHVQSLAGKDRCRTPEPEEGTIEDVNENRRREEAEHQMITQHREIRRKLEVVTKALGEIITTNRDHHYKVPAEDNHEHGPVHEIGGDGFLAGTPENHAHYKPETCPYCIAQDALDDIGYVFVRTEKVPG